MDAHAAFKITLIYLTVCVVNATGILWTILFRVHKFILLVGTDKMILHNRMWV